MLASRADAGSRCALSVAVVWRARSVAGDEHDQHSNREGCAREPRSSLASIHRRGPHY